MIEWREETHNGLLQLWGLDEQIEVYECVDGTWRVWFQHGLSTKELDVKVRNLPSKEAALAVAERWVEEWAAQTKTNA